MIFFSGNVQRFFLARCGLSAAFLLACPLSLLAQVTETQNQTQYTDQEHQAVDKKRSCYYHSGKETVLDKTRDRLRSGLCKTVLNFDHLFGDQYEFDDKKFRGKVTLGFVEDEIDGFKPRLRVKVKAKLPNVSKRLNAFIGRVNEDDYISGTEVKGGGVNNVGYNSNRDDDGEWLVGLGYRSPNKDNDGFDFSLGAKLSRGLNPYAKLSHHHLFELSQKQYLLTKQTLFWKRDDRFGFSSSLDYTHLLNDRNILEWDSSAKFTEEADHWEWLTSGIWHHALTDKIGLSSRIYVRGEIDQPVSIPEYGVNFTYIKPVFRPWLLMELGVGVRWEKEYPQEEYERGLRLGIQFEIMLGDYLGLNKKHPYD